MEKPDDSKKVAAKQRKERKNRAKKVRKIPATNATPKCEGAEETTRASSDTCTTAVRYGEDSGQEEAEDVRSSKSRERGKNESDTHHSDDE